MKDEKNTKPQNDAMKGYDPTDRNFQRTEEDDASKSEKDALNEKTKEANTKPEKDKIN